MKTLFFILMLGLSGVSHAATLLSEHFEQTLAKWDDTFNGLNAQIVVDPLDPTNQVLRFSALRGGGDLMSVAPITGQTGGNYILSFDYLGTCGSDNCGGFVGVSTGTNPPGAHQWIGGTTTGGAAYPDVLPDTGVWEHVTIVFTTAIDPIHLMLEEWTGGDAIAGNAYFDNFLLTDANGATLPPAAVPVPLWTSILTMLLLGFLIFRFGNTRLKR